MMLNEVRTSAERVVVLPQRIRARFGGAMLRCRAGVPAMR
jgi:hypothetical protein